MIYVSGAHSPHDVAAKILYVTNGDGIAIAHAAGPSAVNVLVRALARLRKLTGQHWQMSPEFQQGDDGRTYLRCEVQPGPEPVHRGRVP